MKSPWNKYVGIPYVHKGRSTSGLDCYGLILLVYREEFGIMLCDYLYDDPAKSSPKSVMDEGMSNAVWSPVPHEQLGDVAVYSLMGNPFHTTMILPRGYMLHCMCQSGVVIERTSSSWTSRRLGVFRHEQMWLGQPKHTV